MIDIDLHFSIEVVKLRGKLEFVKIVLKLGENGEDTIEGWMHSKFVEGSPAENSFTSENKQFIAESIVDNTSPERQVLIGENSFGKLKVKISPRGDVVTQVDSGLCIPLFSETATWFQIELWKDYSSIQ